MFDLGFSEIIVIGIVALIVIGPERLPKVARTVGHLLGRLQRYVADVKSDIQREMQLEELHKLQAQLQQQVRDLDQSVRSEAAKLEGEVGRTAAEVTAALSGAGEPPAATAPAEPAAATPEAAGEAAPAAPPQPDPQLQLGLEEAAHPAERR